MFEGLTTFFKKVLKPGQSIDETSKDTAKERLHLVLMQDRANVSADFLDLMKQEIIDVIKKYIEVDEKEIDVRLTNKANEDGTTGAPALYANIPIVNIKNDLKAEKIVKQEETVDNSVVEEKENELEKVDDELTEEEKEDEEENENIDTEEELEPASDSEENEDEDEEDK